METMIQYLQREQRTFEELAFTPVDSLALSTLAYFKMDAAGAVGCMSSKLVLLHDVLTLTPSERLVDLVWLESSDHTNEFVHALMKSRRFRNVAVAFYCEELSTSVEKQFAAVTFVIPNGAAAVAGKVEEPARVRSVGDFHTGLLGDGLSTGAGVSEDDLVYLAFRGTDETVAGWKEDFNLACKGVIPSQISALRYVSEVASSCKSMLMLGGHSKGGNLAEYCALTCDDSLFARMAAVFDHDGPAFLENPSLRIGTDAYKAVLHKTVPSTSVFGLLLESRCDYRIVRTSSLPFASHSPFAWDVQGSDFVYEEELKRGASAFDQSLKQWLVTIEPAQRELFVDSVFELINRTEAATWREFMDSLPRNIATMAKHGALLDSDMRRFLLRTLSDAVRMVTAGTARGVIAMPGKEKRRFE